MSDVFQYAVEQIFLEEGSFSDNPDDRGGPTNMGVTLKELSDYRGAPATVDDIRNLSKDEATKIYKVHYWGRVSGDLLRPPVALLLFDSAVNQGPNMAIKLAQRALHILDDGIIGPNTLKALNNVDVIQFLIKYQVERALYYSRTPSFETFGYGWFRRLFSLILDAGNLVSPH